VASSNANPARERRGGPLGGQSAGICPFCGVERLGRLAAAYGGRCIRCFLAGFEAELAGAPRCRGCGAEFANAYGLQLHQFGGGCAVKVWR